LEQFSLVTSRRRTRSGVLIADDDVQIRRLLSRYLLTEGYEVWAAENGEEALYLASLHQPDLIVLDLSMPVMDGFEALKRLRDGVQLEDGKAAPAKARVLEIKGDKSWLEIIIHEGRNRQVKRMCAAISHKVLRLKRTRFGPIEMSNLAPGKIRALKNGEIEALKRAIK